MTEDEQYLHWLSIFHYAAAAIVGLASCFPVIHLVVGILMLTAPHQLDLPGEADRGGELAVTFIGVLFTAGAASMIVGGWTLAVCLIFAGRFLAKRIHYVFCLVVAGISCSFIPLGTVLGVLTILVLLRPGVKQMFGLEPGVAGK